MENIVQILAFLLFIVVTGASAASKKAREKQLQSKEEQPEEESVFPQQFPRAERDQQQIPKKHTWANPQQTSRERKPLQRRQPSGQSTRPADPVPNPAPAEPVWSKMLREMLDLEEPKPEPVFESPSQSPKRLIRKESEEESSVSLAKKKLASKPKAIPARPVSRTRPAVQPLASIFARAKNQPLQAAILLNEIIQPPRAKRKQIRP